MATAALSKTNCSTNITLFLHFFAAIARPRREIAYFDVLRGTWTFFFFIQFQKKTFLPPSLPRLNTFVIFVYSLGFLQPKRKRATKTEISQM